MGGSQDKVSALPEEPSAAATPDASSEIKASEVSPAAAGRVNNGKKTSEKPFVDRITKSDLWMIGLTGTIAVGGLISAVIFGYQLSEMRSASELTRQGIALSKQSLDASRDALIASQRPWVSAELSINGPFTFNEEGAQISIGVTLKNHGHSPAANVRDFVVLDLGTSEKSIQICEARRARFLTNFTTTIFPEETIAHSRIASVDQNDLKTATARRNIIAPFIMACVDYLSQIDNTKHQTRITIDLVRAPTKENPHFAIKVGAGDVPASDLSLEPLLGNQKAD
jgi:hypothetical protein